MFFLEFLSFPGRRRNILEPVRVQRLSCGTLSPSLMTWLRWLLEGFGVSITTPAPLLFDSTCAISIVCDPVKHELTKHIGVDASFVRMIR